MSGRAAALLGRRLRQNWERVHVRRRANVWHGFAWLSPTRGVWRACVGGSHNAAKHAVGITVLRPATASPRDSPTPAGC